MKAAEPALRLVVSLLWRAQAAHWGVFVLAPLVSAAAQIALGLVMLPFLLLGAGDKALSWGAQIQHLSEPSCWVMLARCSAADRVIVELHSPEAGPGTIDALASLGHIGLRHVWLSVWLLWLLVFLVRRERAARKA